MTTEKSALESPVASGIGLGLARRYAARGNRVLVTGRSARRLDLPKASTDPGVSVTSCDPVAVLRLYEFFAGVDTDRVIEISLPTTRILCPVPEAADPAFADLRNLLRDLVMVRDELGLNLPIPDVWTAQDQRVIRFTAQILRDEHTPFPG